MFDSMTLDASPLFSTKCSDSPTAALARLEFAHTFVQHLQRDGFAQLRNFGIDTSMIEEMFKHHKAFFDLPLQTKCAIIHPGGSAPVRGYCPFASEKVFKLYPARPCPPNAMEGREQLHIGPPEDTANPTLWLPPTVLPHYRDFFEAFYTSCRTSCLTLLQAIELGLSLPSGKLTERCMPDAAELGLNNYPSLPLAQLLDLTTQRIWPHSDLGIISILFQDGVGGLEFEDRDRLGSFVPVSCEQPTDIIVNVGDTLERWTNGILRAGVHRVDAPARFKMPTGFADVGESVVPQRQSTVMLYRAQGSASVGPLPEFVTSDRQPEFEEMTALQYLTSRNKLLYLPDEKEIITVET